MSVFVRHTLMSSVGEAIRAEAAPAHPPARKTTGIGLGPTRGPASVAEGGYNALINSVYVLKHMPFTMARDIRGVDIPRKSERTCGVV